MDAEPLVRGTGRSAMITAVGVWGRVAYAVGGRRDPRPAVSGGDAYGDGRRPPPPVPIFRSSGVSRRDRVSTWWSPPPGRRRAETPLRQDGNHDWDSGAAAT